MTTRLHRRNSCFRAAAALLLPPLTVLLTPSGPMGAEPETSMSVDLGAAYNPLGLKLQGEYVRRWAVQSQGTSHIQGGLGLGVSPAYAQGSFHVEWMPALFAVVRLGYSAYGFFGTSGSLLSFRSGEADFGPEGLDERKGDEEAGFGQRILLQPTLRVKLGPVVLRNQTDVAWYRFHGEGPYFYEQEYDTLLTDGDLLAANRTQGLLDLGRWAGGGVLFAGPFYEAVRARDAGITRQRWGVMAFWEAAASTTARARPHAAVQLGINAQDRNREGGVFAAAVVGVSLRR